MPLNVLYLSNAEEFWAYTDGYRAGVKALPFGRDAVVLRTIVLGDAHETTKRLKGPIDILFLDADPSGYADYMARLLPLVRPGGLILGSDMHPPVSPTPDPRFLDAITKNPDLDTSFIMLESFGISMTLKKR